MTSPVNRRYRAARDRLIDVLGLGETYPLRDLPVPARRLTVPPGDTARIDIDTPQADVAYRWRTGDGSRGPEVTGAALGETPLQTDPITDNVTFEIEARKPATARQTTLHARAVVRVGLDRTLAAHIAPQEAGLPRLADHGARLQVVLPESQEGVDYRLIARPSGRPADANDLASLADDIDLTEGGAPVRGLGPGAPPIALTTVRLVEDVVLMVRAHRSFDPGLGLDPITDILDQDLPVFVRADPALAVALVRPILDSGEAAVIRLAASQASVRYRAHARTLRRADYRPTAGVSAQVPVPGGDPVRVAVPAPAASDLWDAPAGFVPAGGFAQGGGSVTVPLDDAGQLSEDTVIVVEAEKRHRHGATDARSAVRLRLPAVALVRPDPDWPVILEMEVDAGAAAGPLHVRAGQPGVFYEVTPASGTALPELAYMHEHSAGPPPANTGVGALAVEVDFAVPQGAPGGNPTAPPAHPRLTVAPGLPAGTLFELRAIRAQTGLDATLPPRAATSIPPER